MQRILSILLLAGLLAGSAHAQIGFNGPAHPSAALDVKATNKAFYPPRLTTAQRKAIVDPQPGAFVYDLDKGTFYMFDGKNWFPLAFINTLAPIDRTAADGAANDNFGYSVAISGDYALVGSPYNDVGNNIDQGSAYVYKLTDPSRSWLFVLQITDNNSSANTYNGSSVGISNGAFVIGGYGFQANQGKVSFGTVDN